MIEFSIPLMCTEDFTDKIVKLNNEISESKITSVYGCYPLNLPNKCGFEEIKIKEYPNVKTEEDFFHYVKKVQDVGIEFIYTLNSMHSLKALDFFERVPQINTFVENLLKNRINTISVANIQFIDYLKINYPEMKIRMGIGQEYTSIRQYKNLFTAFPNIEQVLLNWDMNKNFLFIRNFKKEFNKEIEIEINDGLVFGSPFKINQNSSRPTSIFESTNEIPEEFNNCYNSLYDAMYKKNPWEFLVLSNVIYPWYIKTYSEKYAVKKFRFAEKIYENNKIEQENDFNFYEIYLKGIENFERIKNMPFKLFSTYTNPEYVEELGNVLIGEIKEYLPDINYFENNGHNCFNVCGDKCRYCHNIAKNLRKKIQKFPN